MIVCLILPKLCILNNLNLITNTFNLNIIVDYKEEYNTPDSPFNYLRSVVNKKLGGNNAKWWVITK